MGMRCFKPTYWVSRMRLVHLLVVSSIFYVTNISIAFAYVDPGSVSLVITAVLGAFAAISYTARIYWGKITSIFKKDESKEKTEDKK